MIGVLGEDPLGVAQGLDGIVTPVFNITRDIPTMDLLRCCRISLI